MIISTLSNWGDHAATFTVNLAVAHVDITPAIGTGLLSLSKFQNVLDWKDNFNLLSIGIILPNGFEFYENEDSVTNDFFPPFVDLKYIRDTDSVVFPINPARITLPSGNYELSINQFFEVNKDIKNAFSIIGRLADTAPKIQKISMINVPADLDGETFHIPIYAKIEHTNDFQP